MSYEKLSETLKTLGEEHVEIDHVLLVKVGCICLEGEASLYGMPATHGCAWLWDETKVPSPHDHIVQALEKHGNVFDLSVLGAESLRLEFAEDSRMFVNGKTFFLKVNLPVRMQKYRKESEEISPPIEQFLVVSNGSLYATFAEIEHYPAVTFVGHEYREIVAAQIDQETPFRHVPFGPSPMHPNFYAVFVRGTNHPSPTTRIYALGNDVFVVLDKKNAGNDIARAIMLFEEMKFELLQFYRTMMDQGVLNEKNEVLLDDFSTLGDCFEEILETSLLHLLKRRKLAASARANLSSIHIALVRYDGLLLAINRDRNRLLRMVKER